MLNFAIFLNYYHDSENILKFLKIFPSFSKYFQPSQNISKLLKYLQTSQNIVKFVNAFPSFFKYVLIFLNFLVTFPKIYF